MKRRDFLVGASAVVAAAIPQQGIAAEAGPAEQSYHFGDFILRRLAKGLQISHREHRDRILWQSAHDGNFILAEKATANVRAFGTPQGSYDVSDKVFALFQSPSIDKIDLDPSRATLSGNLLGPGGAIGYTLSFEALSPAHLRFEIKTSDPAVNRIRMRIESASDEAFFGFGQQLTYFNQKGNLIPILAQEHGVGRGRPIVTQLVDVFAEGGGRNPYVTEAPAPHFITSQLRSLFLENTEYSTFDMRAVAHAELKVWSGTMIGRILFGETPLDLIEAYTEYAGRMRELPDWVGNGAIIGLQGGMDSVRQKFDALVKAGIPLAGLWIQDWSGARTTSAGQQLWWNWRLDESFYPQWQQLVADIAKQGARMLVYINPFLSNTEGHDALFKEAVQKNYLVKTADGAAPYLIKNTDFFAGLIDLANPEARTWIKSVIRDELIGKAGASGWMADFGEALPFDSKLYGNADPAAWHNRYPEAWAEVNREAIEEAGRGDDITFFNRSAFTQSPNFSTLFWLGDQMQTWDPYDGIKTAVVGMLSGGISGFSLLHSDTGGYVSLSVNVGGHKIPVIARSDELLQRWMELAAFTAVFRTHEGLDPSVASQFDSSPANIAHLARFAKIYKGLAAYRKGLIVEAAERGYPVVRHLFLHYPGDANTHQLRYQFLLGSDLLVAPALDKGADAVEVYFPAGSAWIDLWTGKSMGRIGEWSTVPAPLSKPAVFLRKDATSAGMIISGLKSVGVLT